MTDLRLFGCFHMNTRSLVESDLAAFAGDADAFAIENPVEDSLVEALRVNLTLPLVAIGVTLLGLLIQMPMYLLTHRDIVQVELLAVESVAGERPIHAVDQHPLSLLAERDRNLMMGDWFGFCALLYYLPLQMLILTATVVLMVLTQSVRRRYGYRYVCCGVVTATIVAVVGAILAGYLNALVVVGLVVVALLVIQHTLESRNEVMLDEVAALADEHDYEEVCLLTGASHVDGMLELAPSRGLSVTAAFKQFFRGPGARVDTDADPVTYGALAATGGTADERISAAVIDWVVVGVLLFAWIAVVGEPIYGPDELWASSVWPGSPVTYTHLWVLATGALVTAYHAGMESLWGGTIGKQIAGLRVRRYDGSPVDPASALARALAGWVDFLPVGYVLGSLVSHNDRYFRRIGDKLAGTVVLQADAEVDYDGRPATRPVTEAPLVPANGATDTAAADGVVIEDAEGSGEWSVPDDSGSETRKDKFW